MKIRPVNSHMRERKGEIQRDMMTDRLETSLIHSLSQ